MITCRYEAYACQSHTTSRPSCHGSGTARKSIAQWLTLWLRPESKQLYKSLKASSELIIKPQKTGMRVVFLNSVAPDRIPVWLRYLRHPSQEHKCVMCTERPPACRSFVGAEQQKGEGVPVIACLHVTLCSISTCTLRAKPSHQLL